MALSRNKSKTRGAVYASIGIVGIGYEIGFRNSPEITVIILYTAIIGIGIIMMLMMKDKS